MSASRRSQTQARKGDGKIRQKCGEEPEASEPLAPVLSTLTVIFRCLAAWVGPNQLCTIPPPTLSSCFSNCGLTHPGFAMIAARSMTRRMRR